MNTLGMFAKQPIPGRVKTRLAADWGDEQAASLYDCFVCDLLDRFGSVGDRRVVGFAPDTQDARDWFASPQWQNWAQPETDLGGRIAGFFAEWCGATDDRTILIGSDSPSIPGEYLDSAWSLLDKNDCVIGPAADGGYWLIGLRGLAGRATELFDGIDWSSSAVLQQTVRQVSQAGLSLGLLPVWYDVDSVETVNTLRGHLDAMTVAEMETSLPRTTAFLHSEDM